MIVNYYLIAREWDCATVTSRRRLLDAHDRWIEDVSRTRKEGMPKGTEQLDHFKHAAFIAFWLRKLVPINETRLIQTLGDRSALKGGSEAQNFFLQFGNELCAFLIGYQICQYYQGFLAGYQLEGVGFLQNRSRVLRSMEVDPDTLRDVCVVLKHKSLSPHALYLTYRALFTSLIASK